MAKHGRSGLAVVCLADPQPGDFCCIPAGGWLGTGIEVAQFLAGDRFQKYEHAEVYVGRPDAHGPHGYTVSAYPSNGKQGGLTGLRRLPCAPRQLPDSIWSSGIIELTDVERSGIVAWCMTHTDVLYSWPDYGAIALQRLHVRLPIIKEYIASTGHMICSQFTDAAMLYGGDVHLFDDGRWPGDVTPGDLADMLETAAHLAAMRPQE